MLGWRVCKLTKSGLLIVDATLSIRSVSYTSVCPAPQHAQYGLFGLMCLGLHFLLAGPFLVSSSTAPEVFPWQIGITLLLGCGLGSSLLWVWCSSGKLGGVFDDISVICLRRWFLR